MTYTLSVRNLDVVSQRVTVILSDEAVQALDRIAPKGTKSRVISEAVLHYVACRGGQNLAAQLKAGAIANAQRDLEIAQEMSTAS